jgi:hypothetical protein
VSGSLTHVLTPEEKDTDRQREREREKEKEREKERDEFTYPLLLWLPKGLCCLGELANPSLVPWFKILNLFTMLLTMVKYPIFLNTNSRSLSSSNLTFTGVGWLLGWLNMVTQRPNSIIIIPS